MATAPVDIIEAIDAAILAWADEPVSISIEGRSKTFRSLDELTRARNYYSSLLRNTAGSHAFQLHNIKHGGTT